jgi:hypothetical protein
MFEDPAAQSEAAMRTVIYGSANRCRRRETVAPKVLAYRRDYD